MLTHDMAVYMVLFSIFGAIVWLICLTHIVLQNTKRITDWWGSKYKTKEGNNNG